MTLVLTLFVGLCYFFVGTSLFLYGANCFYMTYLAWRHQRQPTLPAPPIPDEWPLVTVQLPLFNELYVAERIINAAAQLDYPQDKLQIQVLDDSTDETAEFARAAVQYWQKQGINIAHLHRTDRTGFKAGALQEGLKQATGEYIAMFDADFIPHPDYLQLALPHFQPHIAFVQARWAHLNEDYSFLTRLQAITLDAHFLIEHVGRWANGYWFNFNGTAGIWRRAALDDAGGWQADTLTEDLDISYRAMLRGWQACYVRDLAVPAELPVSVNSFRRQQHRWARGSLECAGKLLPQIFRAAVPLRLKLGALLHLTGYGVHLFLFCLTLLYPAVLFLSEVYQGLINLYGIALVYSLTAVAPTLFFVTGQTLKGVPWWRRLLSSFFVTAAGAGLMLNTVRAAWQVVRHVPNSFERTAKFGINKQSRTWAHKRYQLKLDRIVWWEGLLGTLNLATAVYAIYLDHWGVAFYAVFFATGLFYVSFLTVGQTVAIYRQQRRTQRQTLLSVSQVGQGD